MGYLRDWIEAERHTLEVEARFPGCLGGTFLSLGCMAPKHTADCSRRRFNLGYGIWCREATENGGCAKLQKHEGDHSGIDLLDKNEWPSLLERSLPKEEEE